MIWDSWQQFFAMGGYAPYVWSAVAAFALGLSAEVWSLRRLSDNAEPRT